jgi:hypothetical protein
MGIIRDLREDFNTGLMDNLRSITYDETGTKSPFVTKDLNNPPENKGLLLQVNKRVDDLTRISKLFINKPGLKFFANEALLKQNDLTEKLRGNSGTTTGNIIRRVGGTAQHVAQVAASTLAQVPVNGTGTHFIRGFKSDTYLQDNEFSSGFAQFFGAGRIEGAKYSLKGKPVPSLGLITNSELPFRNTTAEPGFIGKNHIGIKGNISTPTDISFYSNNIPYYSETLGNISGASRIGLIFPDIDGISNSTATPFQFGVAKGEKGPLSPSGEGEKFNANLVNNKSNPKITFINSFTEQNVINAQRGIPIQTGLPTTVLQKTFGISNKNITGSVAGTDVQITSFSQEAVNIGKYTTLSTEDNINATRNSQGIFFKNSPENLQKSNNLVTTPSKFSRSNTYTKLLTKDNINKLRNSTTPISSDGLIPLRVNASLDPLAPENFTPEVFTEGSLFLSNGTSSTLSSLVGVGGSAPLPRPLGAIQDFRSDGKQFDFVPGGNKVKVPKATGRQFSSGETKTYAFDYNGTKINKETRVNLGNPGKITRNRTNYRLTDKDTQDKLNMLPPGKTEYDGRGNARDLIQLNFSIFTAEEEFHLPFRAFLDTFDDSFNANWNSHKYLGRGEDFYTYGGFDRTINIGFKIAAQTREEMKPLYQKAATLASVTAPSYGDSGRFMRGAIAKVTVGDYIYKQPGIIESVSYTWQTDYPWEISFQNPEIESDKGDQILPHVLEVQLSFKVIHDFLPETGILPFITNHSPINKNKATYIPLNKEVKTESEEKINDSIENNNVEVEVEEEEETTTFVPFQEEPVDILGNQITDTLERRKYNNLWKYSKGLTIPNNENKELNLKMKNLLTNDGQFNISLDNIITDSGNLPENIQNFRFDNTNSTVDTQTENESLNNATKIVEGELNSGQGDEFVTDLEALSNGIQLSSNTAQTVLTVRIPSLGIEDSTLISRKYPDGTTREDMIAGLEADIIKSTPKIKKALFDIIRQQSQKPGFDPINFKDNNNDGQIDENDIVLKKATGIRADEFVLDPSSIDPNNTSRYPDYEYETFQEKFERKKRESRNKKKK